ncbi:hypothetical protein [Kitasatospora aureofaciens]|uniref:hypothetical protein n=1 Tax=Kitasatospora aureofaciens TaxID=1894 RepID=UPI001F15D84F|nr:hypothetical protein [Kitasatospora aureofaciens]
MSLPDYVRRQNALLDGAELPGCPACGEEGPAVPAPTGHGRVERLVAYESPHGPC